MPSTNTYIECNRTHVVPLGADITRYIKLIKLDTRLYALLSRILSVHDIYIKCMQLQNGLI